MGQSQMGIQKKYRMSALIITQCRMTSSRLPGKILLPLGEETVLDLHLRRLKQTGLPIAIATTTNAEDDALVEMASKHGVGIVRGSENDVLQRFIDTCEQYPCDWVIRVTSDCPFIDPQLILRGLEKTKEFSAADTYISNCFPRTYARGFDFELFHSSQLYEIAATSEDPYDHEHVTPYLWKNKNGRMQLINISEATDNSQWRLCIDTREDYELCCILEQRFQASKLGFLALHEIMREHPELAMMNAHIEQKKN
jgi:spore coat polysaccharide biosynthesis protein SpsF